MKEIALSADATALSQSLERLLADLADAPHQVRQFALDFINGCPESLVSMDSCPAAGTGMSVLLKPSQRLLDLALAVRTGNLDLLVVKYSH